MAWTMAYIWVYWTYSITTLTVYSTYCVPNIWSGRLFFFTINKNASNYYSSVHIFKWNCEKLHGMKTKCLPRN